VQCVTAVDPTWLAELGPMFFSIKEDYQSRVLKRKKERQEVSEMERDLQELNDHQQRMKKLEEERFKRSRRGRIATPGLQGAPSTLLLTPLHLGL